MSTDKYGEHPTPRHGQPEHSTPRMHQRPHDPAYTFLTDDVQSIPKVHRDGCYICQDMEFALMGLPLCNLCCDCNSRNTVGHIAADDNQCDDCEHELCDRCADLPPQQYICTCATPCCEVDVGVGIITCGHQHCPIHGGDAA